MGSEQRRAFTPDQESTQELDHIHRRVNRLDYAVEKDVFEDYQMLSTDRNIACRRAGITIRLPRLTDQDDGLELFILDKSGKANGDPITILAAPGTDINANNSNEILFSFGFKKYRFDSKDMRFYIVGNS